MPVIESSVRTGAEQQQKRAAYGALIQILRERHARVLAGGGEKLRACLLYTSRCV